MSEMSNDNRHRQGQSPSMGSMSDNGGEGKDRHLNDLRPPTPYSKEWLQQRQQQEKQQGEGRLEQTDSPQLTELGGQRGSRPQHEPDDFEPK